MADIQDGYVLEKGVMELNIINDLKERRCLLLHRTMLAGWLVSLVLFCSCTSAGHPKSPAQKSWTIAILPDTQYYVRSDENAPIFTEITQWLVDHKDELNLQLVLHVGDIVDWDEEKQWKQAKESLKVFDNELPYVPAAGNHDFKENASDRSTLLNKYFKLSDNPLNEKIFGGYFEEGHLENAWYHFQ